MTTFDDKRIAELRDLIGRLPPAPWIAEQQGGCVEIKTIGQNHPTRLVIIPTAIRSNIIFSEAHLVADARSLPIASSTTAAGDPPAVAAFIAVARTALPEALDEIERLRKAMSVVYAERLRKALETSHRACGAPVMFWSGLGQALEHHPNCCLYEHEIWP